MRNEIEMADQRCQCRLWTYHLMSTWSDPTLTLNCDHLVLCWKQIKKFKEYVLYHCVTCTIILKMNKSINKWKGKCNVYRASTTKLTINSMEEEDHKADWLGTYNKHLIQIACWPLYEPLRVWQLHKELLQEIKR